MSQGGAGVIPLRPHHLLCLLTFVGRGYSDSFARRLSAVAESLNRGTPARLIAGPDAICAGLLGCTHDDGHCRRPSVAARDAEALRRLAPFFGGQLALGAEIPNLPARRVALRTAYRAGAFAAACHGCPWERFCQDIAQAGYAGARF